MEKSHKLSKLSIVSGFLGVLALLLAWCAEYRGFVLGFESRHWYNDAMVLLLIAIWLKLGAIYHKGEK
ncbi:MAG: hypothetical protein U1A25_02250 [Candidatus Sungbacteria bacterium]|nr:hypothetical protein [bacterium]MDZ4260463.1 hypothetical protein [Candidatus Sungbacteria bacterium]